MKIFFVYQRHLFLIKNLIGLVVFLLYGNSGFAQKQKDFSAVIQDLAAKLEHANVSSQPLRLAVVPFGNSQSQTSNKFGEYVTESIISRLSESPGKFKIFERKRLDAILKEDELILSDLMLPSAAQKIGKLVPIDALFSGTYTKLKTYIDINARLIDVSSGEILLSFSGRVKITKNLKSLFPEDHDGAVPTGIIPILIQKSSQAQSEGAKQKSKDEICSQRIKEFQGKLNDLSSEERVRGVVRDAILVPFDNHCGQLHYDMIYSFSRFKIKQPDYESFLLSTLDTIAFPTLDQRASEIIRFVTRDSVVDAREWKTGLSTLEKVGDYSLSNYIGHLLGNTKSPELEQHERVDAYFRLASEGKIGLPKPIAFNYAFFEMMEGVKINQPLRQYVYEKYASSLTLDTRTASTVYGELHSMYEKEVSPQQKTKIIGWIADFFNKHMDDKSNENLYEMAFSFRLTGNDGRNDEIKKQFPETDLKLLVALCHERFTEYAMKSPYQSQQEDRINFCVKYGVPIPGVIPTMQEADVVLKGNNVDEQLRVMKLLVQMGDKTKPLENTFIGLFSKRSLEDKAKMTEVQALAIVVLGQIKTTNEMAIDYITSKLASYNYQESESSGVALVAFGKPSVEPLIKALNKTNDQDGGLRYKIVVILGKIGHDAKPAEASLKKLQSQNTNEDIRYAIEAALQAIH